MELRQLRYFVAVAETLHFGRAAEDLGIVQAAVSQQVARLERELSLPLFDRSHRRVSLTAEGIVFLKQARKVLAAAEESQRVAADLVAGRRGELRIGTSDVLGPRLDAILGAFRAGHPDVRLRFDSKATARKLDDLMTGALDVAFVRAAERRDGIVVRHLWTDDLVAAVPARWADPSGSIDLADLAALPLSLADGRLNPGVHAIILEACAAAGFAPLPGPPFTTPQDTVSGHVAAGECWTLLYASTPLVTPSTVRLHPTRPRIGVPVQLAFRDPVRRRLIADFAEESLRHREAP
ncbi:LysR family transcriptional regulator [Leifsonia sp. AG29]|uniref:LysR family transcriptional regulator n=1 Tax=Leifsonia sp. AG29 TaxID=2598860 RepID=UPI00131DB349|nr:LysR family transcriptional regulator [Leifsonia sp. AG29]